MIDVQQFGELRAQVGAMHETMSRMESKLFGNGTEGLLAATTRIDERLDRLEETVDKLAKSVSELKDTVAAHVKDNCHTPQGLLLKKDVLFAIIGIFLVIHSLIPADVNIWEFIRKLFGY